MTGTADGGRLIQEVLSELGPDEDLKKIATDEFTSICSRLGKARLVHKLDPVPSAHQLARPLSGSRLVSRVLSRRSCPHRLKSKTKLSSPLRHAISTGLLRHESRTAAFRCSTKRTGCQRLFSLKPLELAVDSLENLTLNAVAGEDRP